VGKTNKKLFLFDEHYRIVFERSVRFLETTDEDGDPCESLESLRLSVFDALHEVSQKEEFVVQAVNFASYGASFVLLDETGQPLTPLYNYLKAYPEAIERELHEKYGGVERFSLETASPALGSLNSGLQLYRLQREKPEMYRRVKYAVHLPQYLSFLLSGRICSDMTSIGCHTALWDFGGKDYHQWVKDSGIVEKLPPIVNGNEVFPAVFSGNTCKIGAGLHDSSSALIPYLLHFHEPFILISTGTWCISLNPFNDESLTREQLEKDCLFFLTYSGTPVKASRLFAGREHEIQAKRIADHFNVSTERFRNLETDWPLVDKLTARTAIPEPLDAFAAIDLNRFANGEEAYHALMIHLTAVQVASTRLLFPQKAVNRIFVDGGFSKNDIFMNLLARAFGGIEVYAASMAQATAIGAALAIHEHWNSLPVPGNIVDLRYYPKSARHR